MTNSGIPSNKIIKPLKDKNIDSGVILNLNGSTLEAVLIENFKFFNPILHNIYYCNNSVQSELDEMSSKNDLLITFNSDNEQIEKHLIISPKYSNSESLFSAGHQRHIYDGVESDSNNFNISKKLSLGQLRKNIKEIEPITRMCKHLNFSLSSIRMSEVPGESGSFPSGLFVEEACQIFRYCGESPSIKSINIVYDNSSEMGIHIRTLVINTLVWYAAEGRSNLNQDHPLSTIDRFYTYIVEMDNVEDSIIFYKHKTNEKWWVMLENANDIIPCSYEDYDQCLNGEISNYITNLLLD